MLNFFAIAFIQAASIFFGIPNQSPSAATSTTSTSIDGGTGGWTGDEAATDGGTGGWTGDIAADGGTGGWTGDIAQ